MDSIAAVRTGQLRSEVEHHKRVVVSKGVTHAHNLEKVGGMEKAAQEIIYYCCAHCDFKSRWITDLFNEALCKTCAERSRMVEKAVQEAYEKRDW